MDAEAYDELVLYRQRELAMANTRAELEQLHKRYAAEDRARQEVETKARYAPNGELHDLRQRVAKLERMVSRKGPIVQAVGDLAEHLGKRLHALEQRPTMQYRDVWSADTTYQAGDVVSYGGSMWIAKSVSTAVRPNSGGTDLWRLCVKHGKDGKDAPQQNGPVAR
jgi:chromatin segregation and condensation protein Rec8/ScpA/Scc1 (kleisin family)